MVMTVMVKTWSTVLEFMGKNVIHGQIMVKVDHDLTKVNSLK